MADHSLEILVLTGDEKYAGFLDPDVTDITEINKYGGLRELVIEHPMGDDSQNYEEILIQGNKIWRNETEDQKACLYILNDDLDKDQYTNTLTITAEEVLVELNDAGVLEKSTTITQAVNGANFANWFGDYFTIGTVEACLKKSDILWQGTMNRMKLLRFIEEETGNTFVTRYEKDPNSNIIHRYLDLLQNPGTVHTIPLEVGENIENITENTNESDTFNAVAPQISEQESTGSVDMPKIADVMSQYKSLAVNVGQSIPMFYEKDSQGTIVSTTYWNAPFKKDAGFWEVYLAPEQINANYDKIYRKEASTTHGRKVDIVETSETDKYMIYNACALKLMDKKDVVIGTETKIITIPGLPGSDVPYNVGDTVYIRTRTGGLVSARIEETKKNPRNPGQSDIKIGNILTRTTTSRSDINRPASIDSYTLSQIFGEISDVSESIPGVADGRINSLCPGIANTQINSLTPGIADGRINTLVPGMITTKMGEQVIFNSSGTTTSVTITGLNGGTQKVYKLQGRYGITACTGIPHLILQINGDTGTNYDNEVLKLIDGTVTGYSADNENFIRLEHGLVSANPVIFYFDITVLNGIGGYMAVNAHITVRDTTTLSTKQFSTSGIRKVSENITSILLGVSGGVTGANYNFKVTTPPIP